MLDVLDAFGDLLHPVVRRGQIIGERAVLGRGKRPEVDISTSGVRIGDDNARWDPERHQNMPEAMRMRDVMWRS